MDRAHRSHRWDHWLEFSINPEIQNLLLPKDRKVVALRQRNRRGNLQNWEKADNNGNSKATQIVAFLSENILSGAVKTGQYWIQVDFEPAFRDQKVAGSNPVTPTISTDIRYCKRACQI